MPSGPASSPPPAGSLLASGPGAILASGSPPTTAAAPVTTPESPYVTLQPPSPSGGIPGDATDPLDFFGILVALAVIVVVITAVRLVFRGRGAVHQAERGDARRSGRRSTPAG